MRRPPKRFTMQELQFLKDNFGKVTQEQMAVDMDRSVDSIQYKIKELGFTRKNWTEREVEYLKANYHKQDMGIMMNVLKRFAKAIAYKAFRLGVANRDRSVNNFQTNSNYHGPTKIEKVKIEKRIPKVKAPPKIKVSIIKSPKKKTPEPLFATRQFTSDGKIRVRVDHRTSIYVDAAATPQQINTILSKYKKLPPCGH